MLPWNGGAFMLEIEAKSKKKKKKENPFQIIPTWGWLLNDFFSDDKSHLKCRNSTAFLTDSVKHKRKTFQQPEKGPLKDPFSSQLNTAAPRCCHSKQCSPLFNPANSWNPHLHMDWSHQRGHTQQLVCLQIAPFTQFQFYLNISACAFPAVVCCLCCVELCTDVPRGDFWRQNFAFLSSPA